MTKKELAEIIESKAAAYFIFKEMLIK